MLDILQHYTLLEIKNGVMLCLTVVQVDHLLLYMNVLSAVYLVKISA